MLAKSIVISPRFQLMGKLHQEGTIETVLENLFMHFNIGMLKNFTGFEKSENITDDWLQAYSAPFSSKEECIAAVRLPKSIVDGQSELWHPFTPIEIKAARNTPAIMIEGMKDKGLAPEYYIPMFKQGFPDGKVHELPNAGHYLQEDEPQAIASLIEQFITQT